LTRFVIDASVALCWYLERQKTEFTESVLNRLAEGDEGCAPAIWPLEMVNALTISCRQKAITADQLEMFILDVKDLPVEIDAGGISRSYSSVFRLCRAHQLSSYDAAYLDLAQIEAIPLATLDKNLRTAAKAAGVRLLTS